MKKKRRKGERQIHINIRVLKVLVDQLMSDEVESKQLVFTKKKIINMRNWVWSIFFSNLTKKKKIFHNDHSHIVTPLLVRLHRKLHRSCSQPCFYALTINFYLKLLDFKWLLESMNISILLSFIKLRHSRFKTELVFWLVRI